MPCQDLSALAPEVEKFIGSFLVSLEAGEPLLVVLVSVKKGCRA